VNEQVPLLQLKGVHKSYWSPDGSREIPVLNGVDLEMKPGETLAVVGPSGSGKSTLLALMGGLEAPDAGSVLLEGRDLAGIAEGERAIVRNRRIGFVFQFHHLLPQCSVWENVLVPTLADARNRPSRIARSRSELESRARRLLDRLGLGGRLGHRPAELSGGECLRAAIARALINRPGILLADEPTGSLDARSAGEVVDLLLEVHREEGAALVVVTHASALAGRMARRYELRLGVLQA
jgi:lipoprotein-releasing system ATP-binding protein